MGGIADAYQTGLFDTSIANTVLGKQLPRTDRHMLAGKVTVDGSPASRFITVFKRGNYEHIAVTKSLAETGDWKIMGLPEYPERSLLVVATDTEGKYNAEVADYVSQVATE